MVKSGLRLFSKNARRMPENEDDVMAPALARSAFFRGPGAIKNELLVLDEDTTNDLGPACEPPLLQLEPSSSSNHASQTREGGGAPVRNEHAEIAPTSPSSSNDHPALTVQERLEELVHHLKAAAIDVDGPYIYYYYDGASTARR